MFEEDKRQIGHGGEMLDNEGSKKEELRKINSCFQSDEESIHTETLE